MIALIVLVALMLALMLRLPPLQARLKMEDTKLLAVLQLLVVMFHGKLTLVVSESCVVAPLLPWM